MHQNRITFQFAYVNHEKETMLENGLFDYLKSLGKIKNFQTVSYILKELVGNACKANLKRAHFKDLNLDIKKDLDYIKGLESFKDSISNEPEKYFTLAEQYGYFVKVDFFVENYQLVLSVYNNTPITPTEVKRIQEKFKKAVNVRNIEEVADKEVDFSEGGGLGIIVTMLLIKKLGLNEKVFKILRSNEFTEVKLAIPLSALDLDEEEFVADMLIREIQEIPQLPQHVMHLEQILSNPASQFSDIANMIQQDPSMITDLLKVANSPIYALSKKVTNIEEAVKLIGFKGVRNLVLTYGTQKVLKDRYKFSLIQDIITHSSEVAFYAASISKFLKLKNMSDAVYVAAILHDIGKIIIQAINPEITQKVKKLCLERSMSIEVVESLTDGYNHALLGEMLAKKWNFPDLISESIGCHHNPLRTKPEFQQMVYTVYLADRLYYYRREKSKFADLNPQVLHYFNLDQEQKFQKLTETVIASYEKSSV